MERSRMTDLKPQSQLAKIDFGNPKMQPMIKLLQSSIRRETQRWQPEADIQLRRMEFSIADMPAFSCLILEPENSKGNCLFCHGGGMIFPLQVSSLKVAEYLARVARISVWAPDYHIPPDAPFPLPMQECRRAWQAMNLGSETNILYGESVGGALAASLAMVLRDRQEKQPERLLLIDPVTDCETEKYPSAALDAQAAWTLRNNRTMWRLYLPKGNVPYAVPMRESAQGLPPTYLETAEMDILRDEGEAFGEKLRTAGVPVEMRRISDAWHGFDTEIDHPYVRQTLQMRAHFIRNALGG